MSLGNRVGQFFLWMGGGLVLLFVFSALADQPSYWFLLAGMVCLGIGGALWLSGPRPQAQQNGRFRILQRKKAPAGGRSRKTSGRERETREQEKERNTGSGNR